MTRHHLIGWPCDDTFSLTTTLNGLIAARVFSLEEASLQIALFTLRIFMRGEGATGR